MHTPITIPLSTLKALARAAEDTRDARAWERLARWQLEILEAVARAAQAQAQIQAQASAPASEVRP